eukprot:15343925-Ditylum_brightwellii.AAC.1
MDHLELIRSKAKYIVKLAQCFLSNVIHPNFFRHIFMILNIKLRFELQDCTLVQNKMKGTTKAMFRYIHCCKKYYGMP